MREEKVWTYEDYCQLPDDGNRYEVIDGRQVDASLRAGCHVEAAETDAYQFLREAQPILEPFYRRYGCDLVSSPNGYFYLLPSDAGPIRTRQLSSAAMLVGQALTLLHLDPATDLPAVRRRVDELEAALAAHERRQVETDVLVNQRLLALELAGGIVRRRSDG